jgi:oligopeptide/dipeptide ABC transporter ATP-binding protein
LAEVLDVHQDFGKEAGWKRAIELLKMVGVPDPERRVEAFPHELSGGMAQRVMIAMALACVPELLIADEPTTALDVTIQAQILDLMRDMREKMGTAIILITHDLGVVAEMAERVAVMYAGEIVEQTDVGLFEHPLHPYTQGLIGSIPILGQIKERLDVIPGSVPNLVNLPPGCRFAPRCTARVEHNLTICTEQKPELEEVKMGHKVRCWLYQSADGHTPRSKPVSHPLTGACEMSNDTNHKGETLVEVKNLVKYFPVRAGLLQRVVNHVKAVDDISFFVRKGETLGLVGESGCGKTTVGRTMLRLIEPTSGCDDFRWPGYSR